jgi:hypothetical protein
MMNKPKLSRQERKVKKIRDRLQNISLVGGLLGDCQFPAKHAESVHKAMSWLDGEFQGWQKKLAKVSTATAPSAPIDSEATQAEA